MKAQSASTTLKDLMKGMKHGLRLINLGKMLIVEADHYNFPNNKDHLSEVINKIDAELHGLF